MTFTRPTPLESQEQLSGFVCGDDVIDEWLRLNAMRNHVRNFSRVFLTFDSQGELAGFYSLSLSTVERKQGGRLWNSGPREIPVVLIGRLAVAARHQGSGLGASLLRDAVKRSLNAAEAVAAAAILVHTHSDDVVAFYERFGFRRVGGDQRALVLPITNLESRL